MTVCQNEPLSPLERFLGNLPQDDMGARMQAAARLHKKTIKFSENTEMTGQDMPFLRVKDSMRPS